MQASARPDLAAIKGRQQAAWASGDYAVIGTTLQIVGEQLAEAIDLLTRAIRAGHALTTALRMVADESADPLASEFRRVFDEQKYGMRFEESLRGLTRRIELADVRVMVIAILVQREVGGNLAEILDNIAKLIRTRFSLRRQVRVYTAQGRMSGWVLGGLPVALGGVIYLMNPDYIGLLFVDPTGKKLLVGGLVWMAMGIFTMKKMVAFKI
jgi:tight adherence protein B